MMETLGELIVSLLIIAGSGFTLVGSIGLVKLPGLMTRLHAPTKATTAGVGGVLLASMIHVVVRNGEVSAHELLIALFLFLTAPISAHFLAKAYLHLHGERERNFPPACNGRDWTVFDEPGEESPREDRPQPPPRV